MSSDANLSKTQRKNKKRAEKRQNERVEQRVSSLHESRKVNLDPMEALKQKLAEAKANSDHKLAAKLRQDLWVLQDASAGISPELDPEDLDVSWNRISNIVVAANNHDNRGDIRTSMSKLSAEEKQLRALKKKLMQIQALKDRRSGGEEMEDGQIAKIDKEHDVLSEITSLEQSLIQSK